MRLRTMLPFLTILSILSSASAQQQDKEVQQRVEKDKRTFEAAKEISKDYDPANALTFWEDFLRNHPGHIYTPEINGIILDLRPEQPPSSKENDGKAVSDEIPPEIIPDYTLQGSARVAVSSGFTYNLFKISDYDDHSVSLRLSFDYFPIDHISVGPQITFEKSMGDSLEETFLLIGPTLGASFTFRERIVPYLKITPAFAYYDIGLGDALKKFSFGFGLGLDYLLVEHVALGLSFSYEAVFTADTIHIIEVPLSLAFYF